MIFFVSVGVLDPRKKPILRGYLHQFMFFVALGAFLTKLIDFRHLRGLGAFFVYMFCTLLMFAVSALYHRVNWKSHWWRNFWGRLDHSAIYLMIAGSVTPVSVIAIEGSSGIRLLVIVWIVSLLGIINSFLFYNLPKIVHSLIYISAGYLVSPYIQEVAKAMGTANCVLIILGGVFYTLGGICYGLKRPKLLPHIFGYHEIFHLFVNLGASIHFFAIISLFDQA